MQPPSLENVRGFNRQLQAIHSDLRCIWGEEEYGICRWVIQRKLPKDIHGQRLEEFQRMYPGEDRIIDQQTTDDSGKVIKHRKLDLVNEWVLAHIVKDSFYDLDDDRGYRLPDQRDTSAIWNWLHEFKNIGEQMRAMREEQAKVDAKNKEDRVQCLAEDIRDSRSLWEDPELMYVNKNEAMAGTEI